MSNRFGLNQGTNDKGQYAEVAIPGCGMQTQDNGPVLYIEFENGKPVMYIWGDINQEEPTHKISLEHALESNREAEGQKCLFCEEEMTGFHVCPNSVPSVDERPDGVTRFAQDSSRERLRKKKGDE